MKQLAAVWAFLSANVLALIIVGIAAFLILTRVQSCRDSGQSKDAAVMAERVRLDSLVHVTDSIALANANARLDSALQQGTRVVDRWQTVKVPVYLPPSSTPHDTIQSLAKRLNACYQAGDSLVQSVVKIQSSCSAFRDTATKTIRDQRTAYAHLDSLYRVGKPPKRWAIGAFVGYGIHNDSAFAIRRGFVAGIGITRSIFQF